jgi:hypothetical protein
MFYLLLELIPWANTHAQTHSFINKEPHVAREPLVADFCRRWFVVCCDSRAHLPHFLSGRWNRAFTLPHLHCSRICDCTYKVFASTYTSDQYQTWKCAGTGKCLGCGSGRKYLKNVIHWMELLKDILVNLWGQRLVMYCWSQPFIMYDCGTWSWFKSTRSAENRNISDGVLVVSIRNYSKREKIKEMKKYGNI